MVIGGLVILWMCQCWTILMSYEHEISVWNAWYETNSEAFKDDILCQINTLRASHGLSPITIVDATTGTYIMRDVNVDKRPISLEEFEPLLLDPTIRYITVTVTYSPYLSESDFSESRTCSLTIGV